MATEIERKFLLLDATWNDGAPGTRMTQGYLGFDPDRTVRVRLAGDEAWLTIKGRANGISRSEFEYSIPPADAGELLRLCTGSLIDKTRHRVAFGSRTWEVDVFHGDNDGLVVAEIELETEEDAFELPPWAGEDVSGDPRYANSSLARVPFKDWR